MIAMVAVGFFVELGGPVSMPTIYAPGIGHLMKLGFWRCGQSRQEQMGGLKGLAFMGACTHDFQFS